MSLQDVRDPAGFDAVWLIRHLAACLTRRRPLPPQVVRALRARAPARRRRGLRTRHHFCGFLVVVVNPVNVTTLDAEIGLRCSKTGR